MCFFHQHHRSGCCLASFQQRLEPLQKWLCWQRILWNILFWCRSPWLFDKPQLSCMDLAGSYRRSPAQKSAHPWVWYGGRPEVVLFRIVIPWNSTHLFPFCSLPSLWSHSTLHFHKDEVIYTQVFLEFWPTVTMSGWGSAKVTAQQLPLADAFFPTLAPTPKRVIMHHRKDPHRQRGFVHVCNQAHASHMRQNLLTGDNLLVGYEGSNAVQLNKQAAEEPIPQELAPVEHARRQRAASGNRFWPRLQNCRLPKGGCHFHWRRRSVDSLLQFTVSLRAKHSNVCNVYSHFQPMKLTYWAGEGMYLISWLPPHFNCLFGGLRSPDDLSRGWGSPVPVLQHTADTWSWGSNCPRVSRSRVAGEHTWSGKNRKMNPTTLPIISFFSKILLLYMEWKWTNKSESQHRGFQQQSLWTILQKSFVSCASVGGIWRQ